MSSYVFIRQVKPASEMTREEMINELVLEAVGYIRESALNGDTGLLGDYLEFGFVGFNNMSDEDLRVEYESAFGVDDDREYEDER